MRTADICSTCPSFTNSICTLYDGPTLTNSQIVSLDNLTTVITKLNNNLVPLTSTASPTISSVYLGQLFLNRTSPSLFYSYTTGTGSSDWVQLQNFNLSNNIVADSSSTTKYPSVNAIKTYTDRAELITSSTANITIANTVLSTSITQITGLTSPGSLALPTSPISGVKYIVWNSSVPQGITINTTDGSPIFGQGGGTPENYFKIPHLSIYSFTYSGGSVSGWLIEDLTISGSTLTYTPITIGASTTVTIYSSVTSVTGTIGSGGQLKLPTNTPQTPEFIVQNAASNSLTVISTSPDVFFGPSISGTVTTLSISTNDWVSFRYVEQAGWFVTILS